MQFHNGRRYRVVWEGVYGDLTAPNKVWISGKDFCLDDEEVVSVEVLPDPLKVGDELDGDSPEPPIGTVVKTTAKPVKPYQLIWQRDDNDMWYQPGTDVGWSWERLCDFAGRVAVLYVPEETP